MNPLPQGAIISIQITYQGQVFAALLASKGHRPRISIG
jgi:hypothetical protein